MFIYGPRLGWNSVAPNNDLPLKVLEVQGRLLSVPYSDLITPTGTLRSVSGMLFYCCHVSQMSMKIFVCNYGSASIRSRLDFQSERVDDLLFGEDFYATSMFEGAACGASGTDAESITGFVASAALLPKVSAPTHRVRRIFVHLYEAPYLRAQVRAVLPMNARVQLTGRSAAMQHPSGRQGGATALELRDGGWVVEDGLVPLDRFESDLASVALSFVGAAYLPGGKTWLGCDGPGFVQTVCAACGIRIPRKFDQQVEFFERENLEVTASQNMSMTVAVIYAGDLCGFQIADKFVASRLEAMQVDVSSVSAIYPGRSDQALRVFSLRSRKHDS